MIHSVTATAAELKKLIGLAHSTDLFLSVYLSTSPSEITTEGIRLRLAALLDEEQSELEGTSWAASFRLERRSVESYVQTLRPGGQGLVMLSSQKAQEGKALWLPQRVEDRVRFGPGAYVLPLIDVLDEFEPVALALVERDRARLIVQAAGQIIEERHLEAEVPGMHRAGGGYSTGYRASMPTREAGGAAGDIRERHILVHAGRHFEQVAAELGEMKERHGFRRLFIAAPTETRALFKSHLSRDLSSALAGEFSVDAHATDQELLELVLEHNRRVEREEEQKLVEEIVVRAEKQQGAVTGLDATLWALNRHELHLLALAGEVDWDGQFCADCDILLTMENVLCPQCSQTTRKVKLWEEMPGFAMRHGVKLEVVHSEAASVLWGYDGLGGLLRFTHH